MVETWDRDLPGFDKDQLRARLILAQERELFVEPFTWPEYQSSARLAAAPGGG